MGPSNCASAQYTVLAAFAHSQMDVHHAGNFPQQLHEQQFPLAYTVQLRPAATRRSRPKLTSATTTI